MLYFFKQSESHSIAMKRNLFCVSVSSNKMRIYVIENILFHFVDIARSFGSLSWYSVITGSIKYQTSVNECNVQNKMLTLVSSVLVLTIIKLHI